MEGFLYAVLWLSKVGLLHHVYTSILGIVGPMTGDELYGGRLYALHAFGAQLFKSCDPSFRGATIFLYKKKENLK